MPALVVVVHEPRIGRGRCHLLVEQGRSFLRVRGVNDAQPVLDDPAGQFMVLGGGDEVHGHPERAGPFLDAAPAFRHVIGQRCREQDGIFSVRVEVHKAITA
ncbi:hypothetical protein [Paeniglutamicibacter kerguelensis]|uniref:hypothetical protein n=1 Tax=Paeniglutamicibacter kerguelensis TaxID=254788 RepID=UPI003615B645